MKHFLKLDMLHDNNCCFTDKKVVKKTILGAIFTILVTITYIVLNYQLIYDYFTNKTSSIITIGVNDSPFQLINFNKIPIKFVISDTNGRLVPPGYITVTTKYKFYDYYSKIFRSEERILNQSMGEKECGYNELFLNNTLKGVMCLTDKDIEIYGYWNTINTTYVTIEVSICDESKYSNCKPKEEINEYIDTNDIYIELSVPQEQLTLYDVDSGLKQHKKYLSFLFDKGVYINREIFFSENIMTTSAGFMRKDKIESAITLNGILEQQRIITKSFLEGKKEYIARDNYLLGDFYIFFTNEHKLYERKVVKLEEVINQFGGIFQIFLLFFQFLSSNYVDEYFMLNLGYLLNYNFNKNNQINQKHKQLFANFVKKSIKIDHSNNIFEVNAINKNVDDSNIKTVKLKDNKSKDSYLDLDKNEYNKKNIIEEIINSSNRKNDDYIAKPYFTENNLISANISKSTVEVPNVDILNNKSFNLSNFDLGRNFSSLSLNKYDYNIKNDDFKENKFNKHDKDKEISNNNQKSSFNTSNMVYCNKSEEINNNKENFSNSNNVFSNKNENINYKNLISEFEYILFKLSKLSRLFTCDRMTINHYEKYKTIIKMTTNQLDLIDYLELKEKLKKIT